MFINVYYNNDIGCHITVTSTTAEYRTEIDQSALLLKWSKINEAKSELVTRCHRFHQ